MVLLVSGIIIQHSQYCILLNSLVWQDIVFLAGRTGIEKYPYGAFLGVSCNDMGQYCETSE